MSKEINDPAMGIKALLSEEDLSDAELTTLIDRLRASRLADIANTKARVARERITAVTGEKRPAVKRKVKVEHIHKLAELAGRSLSPDELTILKKYFDRKMNDG